MDSIALQDIGMLKLMLWIMIGWSSILTTIVGFFLFRVISDVRKNTENIGKNKGTIELVKQKQEDDTNRIEQTTQLEIRNLASQVKSTNENMDRVANLMEAYFKAILEKK
jgi:hypothetical protein